MWTKRHSQNAVAAKARLRIARAQQSADEIHIGSAAKIKSAKPDFRIRIESARGERLQVSAWRFNGRVILSDGIKSVRQFCRGLENLITKSA